ncbi:MAG: YbeD family protein [Steroidobacteraceae bacterium]
MTRTPLLTFPTDYPIKVVGRSSGTLRAEADAIIAKHAPDFDLQLARERLSANGNFLSLSYTIRAVSAEQVTALATELTACKSILLVF